MRLKTAFITLSFATLVLPGCGPGFPIMTREQEDLIVNVETMMKENDALKARVAGLEGSSGIESVKRDMDAVKRSAAEANINVERLSQEIASLKGSAEEGSSDRESLNQALRDANSLSATLRDKLASLEASVASSQRKLDALEGSSNQRHLDMKDSIARLEGRILAIEKGAPAAPAASSTKAPADEPEALYQRGYKETVAKEYDKAISTFQKFLSAYPDNKLASNAQYWLGEIYYAKGDWEMAILEFDKVIKNHPGAEKTAGALLKQGFAFEKIGSLKEARVLLQEVMDKFPRSEEASLAKKRLAQMKK